MMKQKTLSILLAMLMSMVACVASAHDFEVDGIYYNITSSTDRMVSVTYRGYDSDSYSNEYTGSVVIRETVTYNGKTYSVTSIGYCAFSDCSGLTSVTIPNSVTSIGNSAFSRCRSLASVTIPNRVTMIGSTAFSGCTDLTSVTINSNTIASNTYDTSRTLAALFGTQVKEYVFGDEVGSIGSYACYNCKNITSVTIPNSVTSIGGSAFSGCSCLTSITIPNSVTSIGKQAFFGCSRLTRAEFACVESLCNIKFSNYDSNPLYYTHKLYIDGKDVKELVIPNSVTSIGSYAFISCSDLTSVSIPNSATSIGSSAFEGCGGLTSVTIPNSVTEIGGAAFYGCGGLTSVTINSNTIASMTYQSSSTLSGIFGSQVRAYLFGDDVTSIGEYACYNCTNLTSVTISNSVNEISSYAFSGCSGLTSVTIPNSVTSIGSYAFSGCNGLTSVAIPISVTSIESSAFYGCSGLTSITIPNSVTSIGNSAFLGCSSLTSVIIPNSVTEIGSSAFYWCSGLTSVTIPNSVTSIGSSAFYGCSGLASVTINSNAIASIPYQSSSPLSRIFGSQVSEYVFGDGVKIIGSYACYNCTNLTSVSIGNSVTKIGDYGFRGCSGLTSVTIPNSVTSIGNSAFQNCNGLTSVTINSNAIASMSDESSSPLSRIFGSQVSEFVFGDGVGCIGNYACQNCTSLTSVTIPSSVNSIGTGVFSGCSKLTSITIPHSVTSIGDNAFYSCSGLTRAAFASVESLCNTKFSNSASNPLYYAHKLYIDGKEITDLVIPNSVTCIGDYTFDGCSGLTSVTIPNSVISIGERAFYGTHLNSFEIGSGVLSIGDYTFEYKPIKTIWLTNTPPSDYKNAGGIINYVANEQYTALTGRTVYPFLSSMFEVEGVKYVPVSPSERTCDAIDCSYNRTAAHIHIGRTVSFKGIDMSIKRVRPYVCYQNTFIKEVMLEHEGDVPFNAFDGCTGLTSLNLQNNGVVGEKAFQNCSKLKDVSIGHSVTGIGEFAFHGCSALKSIVLPKEVTSLGAYAFRNCSQMTSALIGDGVKTIDTYAFSECSSLPSITIPTAVTSIGDYVFQGCSALKEVIMEEHASELTLGSNGSSPLFADCPLDSVYIGRNISYPTNSSNGYSPFYRNTSLRSVHVTDVETEISANEFYGCSNLKNVRLGNGVTNIGDWAFSGCSNLDNFLFGRRLATIGKETFSDCTAMTRLECHAVTPPKCGDQALDDINKWTCTLVVPATSTTAYQQAEQWKDFFFTEAGTWGTYTLSYVVDGEVYSSKVYESGEMLEPEAKPTKEGHTFSGWSEIPEKMPAHDVEVTGTFSVNKYEVTFKYGEEVLSTATVNYGEEIPLPESLDSDRYTLVEWLDVPATMPAHDITIQANFTDGISSVGIEQQTNEPQYYDLSGCKLTKLSKGINIVNGKKVLVK